MSFHYPDDCSSEDPRIFHSDNSQDIQKYRSKYDILTQKCSNNCHRPFIQFKLITWFFSASATWLFCVNCDYAVFILCNSTASLQFRFKRPLHKYRAEVIIYSQCVETICRWVDDTFLVALAQSTFVQYCRIIQLLCPPYRVGAHLNRHTNWHWTDKVANVC